MPTRWNSAFEMIQRVLKPYEHITVALANSHNAPPPFSAEEIDVLTELSKLLLPFEDATLSVSTNTNVSDSLIIPVICELRHKINDLKTTLKTKEGSAVLEFLKSRLYERLSNYETRTIPPIATFLDSRFKKDGFLLTSNAYEAAKAAEQELVLLFSKYNVEQPTSPIEEPTRFSFLKTKVANKLISSRADAIVLLR